MIVSERALIYSLLHITRVNREIRHLWERSNWVTKNSSFSVLRDRAEDLMDLALLLELSKERIAALGGGVDL